METRDHRRLAEYWFEKAECNLRRSYRLAFIFGNIEPDINKLTYLHGFRKQKKFRGHNYDNVMPTLLRMLKKDMEKPLTLYRCYHIGKCFHYIADCFTFPHNAEFTGTMREHLEYEAELHKQLMRVLSSEAPLILPYSVSFTALKDRLEKLHYEYQDEHHNPAQDCSYILAAAQLLLQECLLPQWEMCNQKFPKEIAQRRVA
ncbi:MAG: zinc dependent phospholipase C family protein [Ruminococcus sp.]|nr:zinc dependent phospholipase C family protein [Ruminococcus sp.]